MIADLAAPYPVDYLTTGDHALLLAWIQDGRDLPRAVLCLEDGTAVTAWLNEIKFDYRYDLKAGKFMDVSGYGATEEDEGGDTDQAAPDHGSEGVPGLVPDAEEPGSSDPGDSWDGSLGGLASGPGSQAG